MINDPQASKGCPLGEAQTKLKFCAVSAAPDPADGVTETPYGNVPPPPAAVTVKAIVVLAVTAPLVPFTVSEYEPAATPEATLRVTADVVAAGFVPNTPVIPEGHPEAARVTDPLNPPLGVTVTVELPPPPDGTVAAAELSVKAAVPVTVNAIVVLAESGPLTPLTASE